VTECDWLIFGTLIVTLIVTLNVTLWPFNVPDVTKKNKTITLCTRVTY